MYVYKPRPGWPFGLSFDACLSWLVWITLIARDILVVAYHDACMYVVVMTHAFSYSIIPPPSLHPATLDTTSGHSIPFRTNLGSFHTSERESEVSWVADETWRLFIGRRSLSLVFVHSSLLHTWELLNCRRVWNTQIGTWYVPTSKWGNYSRTYLKQYFWDRGSILNWRGY